MRIFYLFFFFFGGSVWFAGSSSLTGFNLGPPGSGVWSPKHWITSEFSKIRIFVTIFYKNQLWLYNFSHGSRINTVISIETHPSGRNQDGIKN